MLVSGIEIFVGLALGIMSAAGIFYLIRRQDIQVEKYKNEYRDDEDDEGGIRT